ncbi:Mitochondrial protein C2orf69 - like 1 [Theobroma cacao]|nr:Mitochondrial protein C2orf69 - like 1 [Theobroma cacao]
MDRWSGVLKARLDPNGRNYYRVAASLCYSSTSKSLIVPCANAIFFNGDRVEGTRNPVVERLSDLPKIAEVLVSKFGGSINAWVIEASIFNGPFAVYKDFIPSVNRYGEPKSYASVGFPASISTVSILSNCLEQAKNVISSGQREPCSTCTSPSQPKALILGFSKGGTVVNQLVTELGSLEDKSLANRSYVREQPVVKELSGGQGEVQIIPRTKESLLNSISEIHYVDVGLNSSGAYITDQNVIGRISKRLADGAPGIRFLLHGTPRQWCDSRRDWIQHEKDKLYRLLESETRKSGGKLKVCERFYFADRLPDMQMHFEVIEEMDIS